MLSLDLFRTDPERIRAMLESRRADAPLDRLLEVDREWRSIVVRLDEARAARNTGSKEVGALFREGRKEEGEAKRVLFDLYDFSAQGGYHGKYFNPFHPKGTKYTKVFIKEG